MATHFAKFKGLKNITTNTDLTKQYMQRMVVREHVDRTKNMHPSVKQRWNDMTQEPKPLKFQLHSMDVIREAQGSLHIYKEAKQTTDAMLAAAAEVADVDPVSKLQ